MDNIFAHEPTTAAALIILTQALAGRQHPARVEPLGRDSAVRGARARDGLGRQILVYFDDLGDQWAVGTLAPDGMPESETDAAHLDLRNLCRAVDWFTAAPVDTPVTAGGLS